MSEEDVRATLNATLHEARELRGGAELPAPGAGPAEMSLCLLDARQRLDRVEELLAKTIRLRGRLSRFSAAATATVDEKWDRALVARRTSPIRNGDEYSTAKERHAEANLAVLDDRRTVRTYAEVAEIADEAVDVLRLTYRGLDGVRQDLLALLRSTAFESHLER